MSNEKLRRHHAAQAEIARKAYLATRTPQAEAIAWHSALEEARQTIRGALSATDNLLAVQRGLEQSGGHVLVLRHLTAPPISQDQFRLVCPKWQKGTEKNGSRVSPGIAVLVARAFESRRDRKLTPWVGQRRAPTVQELALLNASVAPLIASQQVNTMLRNKMSEAQETAVIRLLESAGWKRLRSVPVESRDTLPRKHFMHKTRFATATTTAQEVDLACGLGKSIALAMECKVTNDETNSVKRINDVIKKAAAWQIHYGNFVRTAALLQGVIKAADVERLIDANVIVFWSHDLDAFRKWLDKNVQ